MGSTTASRPISNNRALCSLPLIYLRAYIAVKATFWGGNQKKVRFKSILLPFIAESLKPLLKPCKSLQLRADDMKRRYDESSQGMMDHAGARSGMRIRLIRFFLAVNPSRVKTHSMQKGERNLMTVNEEVTRSRREILSLVLAMIHEEAYSIILLRRTWRNIPSN